MAKDFTHPKVVESYDEHIRKLIPGYELIHLNIQAILKSHLNEPPKILIAGCGTGYELLYLSQLFPQATFVAIDPSLEMINKAKLRLTDLNVLERIEFIQGNTSVLTSFENQFDVALAILVSHFIAEPSKTDYFRDIFKSLKKGGVLFSYDLMEMDSTHQQLLKNLTELNGLTAKQSQNMFDRLDEDFVLISPDQMIKLLKTVGFHEIQSFMQVLSFYGFISYK